jgi:HAD superfamily hydrolase (TIGR01509 family)
LPPALTGERSERAVLWDLDGTLVDSEEYHWLSWRGAMAGEGIDLTYDRFLASFGQRNDRILGAWLGADADLGRVRRIGDEKEAEYRRLAETHGLTPLPGAREWLEALHAAGWKQAIASSAPRLNVETMLRVLHLTPLLDAIVSAEDVTKGKPDPEVFLTAAAKLGVPPARCVVVEDAPAGVEAGRRAGMGTIGVNARTRLDADISVFSLVDLPADAFDCLLRGR